MSRLSDSSIVKEFQVLDLEVKLGSALLDKRELKCITVRYLEP